MTMKELIRLLYSRCFKKLGFEVSFHSDHDPNISSSERMSYKTKVLRIPTGPALSYQDIQTETQNGKMVIVYYDTLEGVGNQSLILFYRSK